MTNGLDALLGHHAGETVDEPVGERHAHVDDQRLARVRQGRPACRQLEPLHVGAEVDGRHLRARIEGRDAALVSGRRTASGGDVEDHLGALLAHQAEDLAVDLGVVGAVGEVAGVATVDVDDRGAGVVGLASLRGDLAGQLRQGRVALLALDAAVDGDRDDQGRELARALHPLVRVVVVPQVVLHLVRPRLLVAS
jgi:hypothetical protein